MAARADNVTFRDLGEQYHLRSATRQPGYLVELDLARSVIKVHADRIERVAAVRARLRLDRVDHRANALKALGGVHFDELVMARLVATVPISLLSALRQSGGFAR